MHATRTVLPALVCLLTAALGRAQRATEVYIPIGASPGVSGKVTALGTCMTVDARARTLTVRKDQQTWTGKVTAATRIYLDRSKLGLPNTYGTFDDLRDGRLVEVKYADARPGERGNCEWIKVQVTEPSGR